jgi:predicted transcriptional regulator
LVRLVTDGDEDMSDATNLTRATDITLAWLASPHTRADADQAGAMLAKVYEAVGRLGNPEPGEPPAPDEGDHKPAVGAKASLKIVGRIISMIDGKPYASLIRHIKAHGLTPDEYRARYQLPKSYPMVAPAYSETRSKIARTLGFGRGAKEGSAEA